MLEKQKQIDYRLFSVASVTSCGCWLIQYTTATQIHKIVVFLMLQMQMKCKVMVASNLLPLYF